MPGIYLLVEVLVDGCVHSEHLVCAKHTPSKNAREWACICEWAIQRGIVPSTPSIPMACIVANAIGLGCENSVFVLDELDRGTRIGPDQSPDKLVGGYVALTAQKLRAVRE